MGTNFYLHREPSVCPACGHDSGPPPLHIGKSSFGWCFSLHVEPDDPSHPQSLDDWVRLFEDTPCVIKNEYGDVIDQDKMVAVICGRGRDGSYVSSRDPNDPVPGYASMEEFYRANHAVPGPYGLSRHEVDGRHCVGHGPGTWDLIVGEFS